MTAFSLVQEIRAIENEIRSAVGDDFETDCIADLGIVLAFEDHFVFNVDSMDPEWVYVYVDVYNNFTPSDYYAAGVNASGGRLKFLEKAFSFAQESENDFSPVRVKWFRVRSNVDDGAVYRHLEHIASSMTGVAANHPEYFCV